MPIADCIGGHLCVSWDLEEESGYTLSLGPHLVSWNEGPDPSLRLLLLLLGCFRCVRLCATP